MSDEVWTVWTDKKRRDFIEALAKGSSVTKAAAAAKVARQTAYNLREKDETFAAEWDAAVESGTDVLEDEALRRAKDGTLKPIYQKGFKVGQVREYSDTLMIVLLKARRPEKYRELKDVKHSGLIQTQEVPLDLSNLNDDDLADLERINTKLAADTQ